MGVKVAKSSTWSNLSNSISHRECKHKMDATVLKIRVDRVVKNIVAYIMLGITLEGKKEILGIWIGENETSKYWLTLLNELKNRGVEDILIFQ